MQERHGRILSKILPARYGQRRFDEFASLLNVAMFEDTGFGYRMPDHVCAEESRPY